MILYPAIDLKDGKCVRLTQGNMDNAKIYNENPAEQAAAFERAGFSYLHLVDLDGAFQGKPANEQAIKSILSHVNMPVQLGGGLRNMDVIGRWLSAGIARVILGTVAQKNPIFVKEVCRQFPDQVVVGIDAVKGKVAINGWKDVTEQNATDLAKKFEDAGVSAIIYTDIDRDGAMAGPNIEETVALAEALTIPIIASGGITSKADIDAYRAHEASGIQGIIIGKALYEGTIDVREAVNL
jgi:phosphoribosylformimino-5-aminoimidazole carboxamide ribotide isomerase